MNDDTTLRFASVDLAAMIGSRPMSSDEAWQRVLAYVERNRLRDATDPDNVWPDLVLLRVFGSGPISEGHMREALRRHLV